MLSNIRISVRLGIGVVLTLLVVVLLMLPAALGQLGAVTDRAEARELEDLHHAFLATVSDRASQALVTITSIVTAKGVADAFSNGDRAQLQALTLPVFEALKKNHNVTQFQFHVAPATSFLRLHQPEKYGDDLKAFRATVVKANETKKAQSGLESGIAGLGLRGVIPVFHKLGAHVGSAEIGISFGQDFFESFKKQYNAPAALHIRSGSGSGFDVFASTIPGKTTLTAAQVADALAGKTVMSQVKSEGREWSVMAKAVPDFSGQPIAVAEILVDRSEYAASYSRTLTRILAIGAVALAIGLLLAWILSVSITKPIERLTNTAEEISRGKFEGGVSGVERKDEIGDLARAIARMAASIKIAMERIRKTSL